MAFKLSKLKGELGEVIAKLAADRPMTLKERGMGAFQIWASGDYLHIKGVELYVVPAVMKFYKPQEQKYTDDLQAYYIFDANGEEVDFASDCTMAEIIYAYCDYMGMSRKEADKLKCTYEFDGGQFLFHKVINRETFEIHGEIDI